MMADLVSQLAEIDASTFDDDEAGRLATLSAAKALVARLERPFERVLDFVWSQPTLMLCLKVASDMRLFHHLDPDAPTSLAHLATATKSDPALLRRVLRVLVCGAVLDSPGLDTYAANRFSRALRAHAGLRQGIEVVYATSIPDLTNLPAYLKFHNYRNLTGQEGQQPWEWIFSLTPSQYSNIWDYMRAEMPERHAAFNGFLSAVRSIQTPWTEAYPLDGLVRGWRRDTVFCVDVGGGQGQDLAHLAEALNARADRADVADARLVLQETPTLLASLGPDSLHPRVEATAHDFFTPQPVRGARLYFLRSVLINWPDFKAREILLWLKTAMTPGYSRILLVEDQMPESPDEAGLLVAALDVDAMAHCSASVRTAKEWNDLIEGVGLTVVGFKHFPRRPSGAIEIEL